MWRAQIVHALYLLNDRIVSDMKRPRITCQNDLLSSGSCRALDAVMVEGTHAKRRKRVRFSPQLPSRVRMSRVSPSSSICLPSVPNTSTSTSLSFYLSSLFEGWWTGETPLVYNDEDFERNLTHRFAHRFHTTSALRTRAAIISLVSIPQYSN